MPPPGSEAGNIGPPYSGPAGTALWNPAINLNDKLAYFGWNLTPQSDADIICDGMVVLIGALAFLKPS